MAWLTNTGQIDSSRKRLMHLVSWAIWVFFVSLSVGWCNSHVSWRVSSLPSFLVRYNLHGCNVSTNQSWPTNKVCLENRWLNVSVSRQRWLCIGWSCCLTGSLSWQTNRVAGQLHAARTQELGLGSEIRPVWHTGSIGGKLKELFLLYKAIPTVQYSSEANQAWTRMSPL